MDLGSGSVFLEISMILATFKIEPGLDADGRTIEPVCEFSTGIIRYSTSCFSFLAQLIEIHGSQSSEALRVLDFAARRTSRRASSFRD